MTANENILQKVKEWGFGFVVIFAMLELKYLFKEDYFSKVEIANFIFSRLKERTISSYANNVLVTLYRLHEKNFVEKIYSQEKGKILTSYYRLTDNALELISFTSCSNSYIPGCYLMPLYLPVAKKIIDNLLEKDKGFSIKKISQFAMIRSIKNYKFLLKGEKEKKIKDFFPDFPTITFEDTLDYMFISKSKYMKHTIIDELYLNYFNKKDYIYYWDFIEKF